MLPSIATVFWLIKTDTDIGTSGPYCHMSTTVMESFSMEARSSVQVHYVVKSSALLTRTSQLSLWYPRHT